jgi:hypothetical protein
LINQVVGCRIFSMEEREWAEAHVKMLAVSAYCASRFAESRSKAQEPLLALDAQVAYLYSLKVLRGRFVAGERSISMSPEWAVRYARFVLKDRFKRAEKFIIQSPRWAYEYAEKVIGGRLPPAMHRKMASMMESRFARRYMEDNAQRKPGKG